ncbi:hypothetical protein CVT24_012195 [Panaeolus cyanescens]|uniref:Uncharacterized protein n=1 Tax=Panaeolus cyanescens TaxID=181874 RepID=A0A409WX75_9AGAR|nr:hypothetical protein CVT24_012195 [Panaeolus cyanescens]
MIVVNSGYFVTAQDTFNWLNQYPPHVAKGRQFAAVPEAFEFYLTRPPPPPIRDSDELEKEDDPKIFTLTNEPATWMRVMPHLNAPLKRVVRPGPDGGVQKVFEHDAYIIPNPKLTSQLVVVVPLQQDIVRKDQLNISCYPVESEQSKEIKKIIADELKISEDRVHWIVDVQRDYAESVVGCSGGIIKESYLQYFSRVDLSIELLSTKIEAVETAIIDQHHQERRLGHKEPSTLFTLQSNMFTPSYSAFTMQLRVTVKKGCKIRKSDKTVQLRFHKMPIDLHTIPIEGEEDSEGHKVPDYESYL